jgi:predicted Zn-dependent protease
VSEAGSRYGSLTMLLGLADRWQWRDKTTGLLEQIVEKFPQERWAQHALELQYLASGSTQKLLQFYSRLFARFPQEDGLKNNLAAVSLLLNTNVPQACRWAEEVYAGRTNDLIVVSTYAFALHLQGRTLDGLVAMSQLDDKQLQQPEAALYYGVLLAANGATNEAAQFLKIAQTRTQWLPEEKQLLKKALGE